MAERLLARLPRRRPITLAIQGVGPHAGLAVTPWVLGGLLGMLVDRERTPVNLLVLGDAATAEASLRRAVTRGLPTHELIERIDPDRNVLLHSREREDETATVSRELIGTSLMLVLPLLHRRSTTGGRDAWHGPLAAALGALARALGSRAGARAKTKLARASELSRTIEAGHRLVGEVFADGAALIDATWAGVADAEPEPSEPMLGRIAGASALAKVARPSLGIGATEPTPVALGAELVAPEQALGIGDLASLPLSTLLGVDEWLAHLLGLGLRSGAVSRAPEVEGTLGRWPHLQLAPRGPDPGLAGRAIAGLRSQARAKLSSASPRASLPARVPGRFSAEWTRSWYGDVERNELERAAEQVRAGRARSR